jgi:hypothetical protein
LSKTQADREAQMLAKGYMKATEANLQDGKTYLYAKYMHGDFSSGWAKEEKVRCVINKEGRYFLMPTRNRTRGYPIGS